MFREQVGVTRQSGAIAEDAGQGTALLILLLYRRGRVESLESEKMPAKRWYVSGRVQGVGFRRFVELRAAALRLDGYTRNLDDGRVEVYASGPSASLSELSGLLWQGPPFSDVRTVEEQEAGPEKVKGFRVEHR